jgi:hypothetical protein
MLLSQSIWIQRDGKQFQIWVFSKLALQCYSNYAKLLELANLAKSEESELKWQIIADMKTVKADAKDCRAGTVGCFVASNCFGGVPGMFYFILI